MIRDDRLKSTHEKELKDNDIYNPPESIRIYVGEAVTHETNGKPTHTSYKITTETTFPEYKEKQFSVRRRYKEFVWLRNHLKDKLAEKGKKLTLANLPGNTVGSFFGPGRFDKEFIEERRKGLEEFLNSVVNHPFSRFEKNLEKFISDPDWSPLE